MSGVGCRVGCRVRRIGVVARRRVVPASVVARPTRVTSRRQPRETCRRRLGCPGVPEGPRPEAIDRIPTVNGAAPSRPYTLPLTPYVPSLRAGSKLALNGKRRVQKRPLAAARPSIPLPPGTWVRGWATTPVVVTAGERRLCRSLRTAQVQNWVRLVEGPFCGRETSL